ncbi:hypothetical protein ACOSP7_015088 [Xanthoceras sorbifolium]
MGRSPCCSKEGLNRGAWTAREDKILRDYITLHGEGGWRNVPKKAGLKRCGKSCRLRWLNYLRPDIKRGNISPDEEELIIRLHKLLGNRWSLIAGRLPGRTDNEIKNYWNTNLVKKVQPQCTVSASTPPKLHPNQPNHNKSSSQSPFKMASHVIKTKAVKCSKVFINPDSSISSLQKNQHFGTNPDTAATTSSLDDNNNSNKPIESDTCNSNPSDFIMDLNAADFNFSDLLNPDFWDLCGFTTTCDGNEILSPSSFDQQPLVFSEETFHLQDEFWRSDIYDSASENVASFLNSLSPHFSIPEESAL